MKRLDRRSLLLLAVAFTLLLAGCGPTAAPTEPPAVATEPPAPEPTDVAPEPTDEPPEPTAVPPTPEPEPVAADVPEEIVVGDVSDLETLDATLRVVTNHRRVYGNIYDSLFHRLPDGELVPWLVEDYELVDDTHWRFKLKEGIKFHNGEDLNAEAVKFTLDRMRDAEVSQAATTLSTINDVTVVDDYTFEIETTAPDVLLIKRSLADQVYIAPPGYFEEVGADEVSVNPVGSGPYVFKEWVKGDHLTLEANEDYWGGDVPVKTVTFRAIPEAATRVSALLNGEIDIAIELPASQLERVDASDMARVSTAPDPLATMVWLRPDRIEPLKDVRVRQALNYAVDKELLIDAVLFGRAKPLNGPIFIGSFGYNPDLDPYPYDPEKAKELMAEAGYPDGFEMKMLVPIGGVPQGPEIAQAVASDLAKVGVDVEISTLEWAAYLQLLFTPNSEEMPAETYLLYQKAPALDGDGVLQPSFRSDGFYPDGWNWGVYVNTEVDELIKVEQTTFDEDVREKAMQEAGAIIREDAPWIFLYSPEALYGVNDDISWETRPDGMIFIWDVYQ